MTQVYQTMPWQRSSPWPYDMKIGGVGVMLRAGQDGQLVATRSRRVNAVAPSSYAQEAQNPYVEVPFALGRLVGGMGQAVQSGGQQSRYKIATNVDCSVGGIRRLGPAFYDGNFPGLPAATYPGQNAVRQFVVGPEGSSQTAFALVRDRVYKQVGDPGNWVLSKDFSATGADPMQAVWFGPRSGSAGLFVATDIGELWRYDGAAWVQATLGTDGAGNVRYAQRVEAVGDQLYAGAGDLLWVTGPGTDPTLAASWGGAIEVGDHRTRISGLKAVGGVLFVFKWDNVHSLNADGSVNDLFPEFRARETVTLGQTAAVWEDRIWFGVGPAYYRLDSAATLEPIGPERVVDHGTLRARVVSTAGHNDWFNYAVAHDPSDNHSSLLKWGTWTNVGESGGYRFADAWHGEIAVFLARKATRCDVVQFDTELYPSLPGPELWVGFEDGTAMHTPLPTTSPDPLTDPRCRFTGTGTLDWPDHDAGAPADFKHWRKVAVAGPRLDLDLFVQVALSVDGETTFTDVGSRFDFSGETMTPAGAARVGRVVRVRETLRDTVAVGPPNLSPEVSDVILFEQIRPERLELEFAATILVGNRVARRDGALDRRSAPQIRAALTTAAGEQPVSVVMPEGLLRDVDVVQYGEMIPNPNARWGVEWEIPLTLVQWRPTPEGT